MAYLAALSAALLLTLFIQQRGFNAERRAERDAFADERQQWVRERRDLNTRIQMPQAAPFLLEDEAPSDDDMPVMPDFTLDEAELEKARQALTEAGYEEGPAL